MDRPPVGAAAGAKREASSGAMGRPGSWKRYPGAMGAAMPPR